MKSPLKIVLCSFLWLVIGLWSTHAFPTTATLAAGDIFWQADVEDETLPAIGCFQRAQRIAIPSVKPELILDGHSHVIPWRCSGSRVVKQENFSKFIELQDQRYTLSTTIFPFHFFW